VLLVTSEVQQFNASVEICTMHIRRFATCKVRKLCFLLH